MLFIDSLLAALSPFTLAMNFVGVMLGMIVGALPGLGSVVAITICLPFTFGMTSVSAIALLLGVYCGSICGGSIAAVLINTPGTPQSAATAFDGYPMARAGKAGKARFGKARNVQRLCAGGIDFRRRVLVRDPYLRRAADRRFRLAVRAA